MIVRAFITRLIAKHGFIGTIILIGDIAVKITKTKKDDKAWAKVRKVLKKL